MVGEGKRGGNTARFGEPRAEPGRDQTSFHILPLPPRSGREGDRGWVLTQKSLLRRGLLLTLRQPEKYHSQEHAGKVDYHRNDEARESRIASVLRGDRHDNTDDSYHAEK